jgi:hypothetical protein
MASPIRYCVPTFAIVLLFSTPVSPADGDPFSDLPARAFVVQGGVVAVRGGVTRNWEVEGSLPFGKLRYPTRYFAHVTNETPAPIFVDAELTLPKKDPSRTYSEVILPGKSWIFWWSGLDVVVDQSLPLRIGVYADKHHGQELGREQTALYFEAEERKTFLESFTQRGGVAMLSGWREMRRFLQSVPETVADAELARDVHLLIWKEESKRHRDCEHQVLEARDDPPEQSAYLARYPEEVRTQIAELHGKDRARTEVWRVKSCEAVSDYAVWMLSSPGGGTDILAGKTDAEPRPDAARLMARYAGSGVGPAAGSPAGGSPPIGPVEAAGSPAGSGFTVFERYRDQFTIELPSGWHFKDQGAMTGAPGPNGLVTFAARELPGRTAIPKDASKKDMDAIIQKMMVAMGEVDSGAIPSVFVERYTSLPGASCAALGEEAKRRILSAATGSALGKKAKVLESPQVEDAPLGGCQGLRVMVKAKDAAGEEIWMLVHSVSDGTTGYDFALRNHKAHFERNLPVFLQALATVKLAAAPGR